MRPTPDLNLPAATGNTPLHAAAHCGYHEVAKILLDAPQVNKNPRNADMDDATPLHLAAINGNS